MENRNLLCYRNPDQLNKEILFFKFFFYYIYWMLLCYFCISTISQCYQRLLPNERMRYTDDLVESGEVSAVFHRYHWLWICLSCMCIYIYITIWNPSCILSAHTSLSVKCFFTFYIIHYIRVCYFILCDSYRSLAVDSDPWLDKCLILQYFTLWEKHNSC